MHLEGMVMDARCFFRRLAIRAPHGPFQSLPITYLYCIMSDVLITVLAFIASTCALLFSILISWYCLRSRQPNKPVSHVESGGASILSQASQCPLSPGDYSQGDVPLQCNPSAAIEQFRQKQLKKLHDLQQARSKVNVLVFAPERVVREG